MPVTYMDEEITTTKRVTYINEKLTTNRVTYLMEELTIAGNDKNKENKVVTTNEKRSEEMVSTHLSQSPNAGQMESELERSISEGSSAESEKTMEAETVKLPSHIVTTHQLKYPWVLWTQSMGKGRGDNKLAAKENWTANLHARLRFDTVEGFWVLIDTIMPSVGRLSPGKDYFLFKEGIEPCWEHEANQNGGRWVLGVRTSTSSSAQVDRTQLEACWMKTVMAVVGAHFGEGNEAVCGVVASVRLKQGKVALWLKDADDKDAVHHLGEVFKSKMLQVPYIISSNIYFDSHKQCLSRAF